jgi:hypothetical protein
MKSLTIVAFAVFALATVGTAEGKVSCPYPNWKKTCQRECLKHGSDIQANRCYSKADLMCKCNDKDMTSEILAILKPNASDTGEAQQSDAPASEEEEQQSPKSRKFKLRLRKSRKGRLMRLLRTSRKGRPMRLLHM